MPEMPKWDRYGIQQAILASTMSKDPSTKVGAAIFDGKRLVSTGYNGLAAGVVDDPERLKNRDVKYEIIVHAEINAILFARRSVEGMTLFTYPFSPCPRCTAVLINAGLWRVVWLSSPTSPSPYLSSSLTKTMLSEAGITWVEYTQDAQIEGV